MAIPIYLNIHIKKIPKGKNLSLNKNRKIIKGSVKNELNVNRLVPIPISNMKVVPSPPLNLFNLYFLKNVTSNLLNEAIEIHCGNIFKFAEIN